jgi:hypothetical protein
MYSEFFLFWEIKAAEKREKEVGEVEAVQTIETHLPPSSLSFSATGTPAFPRCKQAVCDGTLLCRKPVSESFTE